MSARRAVKKKKANWVLRFLLVACAAFLFLKLMQMNAQIEAKKSQLSALQEQKYTSELLIEDLVEQNANAHEDEYLERQANESGLVLPGQQIFQNAAG